MKLSDSIHIVLLLFLLIGNYACGFHLGGASLTVLQDSQIHIRSVNANKLKVALKKQLQLAGIDTDTKLSQADYLITLSEESYDTSVAAVSEKTGKVQAYELTYSVELNIARGDKTVLVANQQMQITQDYSFDENSLTANTNRNQHLKRGMIEKAAKNVIRRLQAVIR